MNKDIKYIIRRVFIGVCIFIIISFIKSCNAKAYTNNVISGDAEFPTGNATFLSMNENYRITNVGYRYFFGSTLNPTLYFASPTTNNVTCGTYGCGISIDGLSTVKDSYYSITIFLLGDSSPYWHYSYSSLTNKVGVSNGYSTIDPDFFVAPISGTTGLSRSCGTQYDNEYTGNCLFQWTILFKSPRNGSSIQTWWSSNPAGADPQDAGLFVGYNFHYVGDSSLTPEQLNTALNNVTTSINNNINTNTQNIINNQNNNTNSIINNIISNTQQIIDSNKVCNNYDKNYIESDNKYLKNDGSLGDSSDFGVSSYINIEGATIIPFTILQNVGANYCFYNVNKTLISCYSSSSMLANTSLSYPNNASFLRFTVRKLDNRPQLEICKNGSQAINESMNQVNDTMKDDNVDSPNSGINAVKNGLASNGVITQLITLPVTLFQQILTSINGTCQTFNLGSLLGTELILPCINVSNYLGTTLWGIIDVIISGYFVWVIARKMISAFEMFSAMKDGDVLDD